jgi:hypothetical protein
LGGAGADEEAISELRLFRNGFCHKKNCWACCVRDKEPAFLERPSEKCEFNLFQKTEDFFSGSNFVFPKKRRVFTEMHVLVLT